MRKMNFGNGACEVTVNENFELLTEVSCEYNRDTVAYAVEIFIVHNDCFCRECVSQSVRLRFAKGKARRPHGFTYLIPAERMELPGEWVLLSGRIDNVGVEVHRVKILENRPVFKKGQGGIERIRDCRVKPAA